MSFRLKPATEIISRVILTIIVLLNAAVPTAAFARQAASEETLLPANTQASSHAQGFPLMHIRNRASLLASVQAREDGPLAQVDDLAVSSFELETAAAISANSVVAIVSPIQFNFSAAPSQANPGDSVLFTVKISNSGDAAVSGLVFSNVLPAGLNTPSSEDANFEFDSETHTILWDAGITLDAGQSATFHYTASVDTQINVDTQIVDEASLFIAGSETPLSAALDLAAFPDGTEKEFTFLGAQGGDAQGVDDHVLLEIPSGELDQDEGILIEKLTVNTSENENADLPLIVFKIDLVSQVQAIVPSTPIIEPIVPAENANPSVTPTVTNTTEALPTSIEAVESLDSTVTPEAPTSTITPTVTVLPSATDEPVATDTPQPTSTPVIDTLPESQEHDLTAPLQKEEAQFDQPVEITVSFDGILDLSVLGADSLPYVVTLDEVSGVWVNVPLTSVDRENNTITVETTHFSTWGAGIGSAFPQNGANILLFDSAYPSLFTGRSNFSLPIWTPPGRNGMQPSLALSYSSGSTDGVLGDVQAPWVGMGWSIDTVEIARKITNYGEVYYGYENKFILLINGAGYELIPSDTTPDRYHTKDESFLYIQRHNDVLGNAGTENETGEWWEVVEQDGKRWRLGWNPDSEQLTLVSGYPGTNPLPSGPWANQGYAGNQPNLIASRWRADRVSDVYGNQMSFTYFEEHQGSVIGGNTFTYDRASYIDTIQYTNHVTDAANSPTGGYSVEFILEDRGTNDMPTTTYNWDNWDTKRLDRIDVKYGTTVVRSYNLVHNIRSYTDDGHSWKTTTLSTVTVSGSGLSAPTTTFGYVDQANRANCGTGCQEWAYPRLETISNGTGGTSTFVYENDGRPYTWWYNWRVKERWVADGVNASPMKTTFVYSTPCYDDPTAGRCNGSNLGSLIGYGQTNVSSLTFAGAVQAKTIHKFWTSVQLPGREYETQYLDAASTILRKTLTNHTYSSGSFNPSGGTLVQVDSVDEYINTTSLVQISHTVYGHDTYGNINQVSEYDGANNLYRQTVYDYVVNTSPSVWIINALVRRTLKDGAGTTLSKQEYGYGGNLPGVGSPTTNKPDLSRVVNGTQTIDTKYVYDSSNGNLTDTRLYKNYGTTSSQPSGTYLTYATTYDTALQTYPLTATSPVIPATQSGYNYGLGVPTTITDPNGNTTTTAYDGLGRVTSVTYPGYGQANVKYTYPTTPVTAPFKILMEVWDETILPSGGYRSTWQIMDGLGRAIQTQGPSETSGVLVLSDTSYDGQGQTLYGGLPRTISGTGGSYSAPSWGSIPHSTTSYDALGRVTSVAYPAGDSETFSYFGLQTTSIDRNSHKKVQENDIYGRLVKVQEYTGNGGAGSGYALYATTTYEYYPHDLLKKVIDAANNQTTITYNGFGRKTGMTDPDMGSWSYAYDIFGNLTDQTDARSCTIQVAYDDLNRPTTKTYSGSGACASNPQVTYSYDSTSAGNEGLGRRTGMTDSASGTTSWFYNILGQVTKETRTVDSNTYEISATFDAFSRPITQTLPTTEVLNFSYNARGTLSGLTGTNTYVSNIHYSASGQVIDQQLGNSLIQQSCYDTNTLRVITLRTYPGSLQSCVASPSGALLNLSYLYQPNGNISRMVDATKSETLNYTYDEIDRLLNVKGTTYSRDYGYDAVGNFSAPNTMPLHPGSTGLAAWWSMNETGGSRLDSKATNHLTSNNGTSYTTGLKGNAASFVAASLQSLFSTDNVNISAGNIDFTWSANVYLNNGANSAVIIDKSDNASTIDYRLSYTAAGGFRFRVGSGTVDSGPVSAGAWHTVVAWHDSVNDTLNIQVDNGTPSSISHTGGGPDSTNPLYFGISTGGTSAFDGRIDEAFLYKRILTTNERSWLYNTATIRTYADVTSTISNPGTSGLVSWWSLNETSGTRGDSHDINHLTSNNATGYAAGIKGNAAKFLMASSQSLSMTDNPKISTGDIDFTWIANVYVNNTANSYVILDKTDNSSVIDYRISHNSATGFRFRVGSSTVDSGAISANTWYTVVAWHDSVNNTINIQVNNGSVNSASLVGGGPDSANPLYFGMSTGGTSPFDGRIDEAVMYKRVLTASERSWFFNSGARQTYADLNSSVAPQSYTYTDTNHKHAVTSMGSGETYTYDANGNMLTRFEGGQTYTQTYNAENRLASVTVNSQTTQFIYDGDGTMVKQINPDGSKLFLIGGVYQETRSSANALTEWRVYYPAAGAMRVFTAATSTNSLYYTLKDHLGSASVVTDASGNFVDDQRYTPYGQPRLSGASIKTDRLFTGQRNIPTLGLVDYKARMYSPTLGRFIQPDTIVPNPANPQAWNRYSYVANNPIKYIDPTGHKWACTGANSDHCYDDGNFDYPGGDGGLSGMATNKSINVENDQYSWQRIVNNMVNLGIYGNAQAGINYVVGMEFNNGIINANTTTATGTQGFDILQGMKNRYAEYCTAGAWSENCVSNFWGYHEPILNTDSPHGAGYYSDEQNAQIPQLGALVLNANQDPGAGCSSGSANICHYALARPGLIAWAQIRNMNIQGGGAWSYQQATTPNDILHIYNNYDSYFVTMSQAFYESLFPGGLNYCPECVY